MDDFSLDDAIVMRNIKTNKMEKDMFENHGRNHIMVTKSTLIRRLLFRLLCLCHHIFDLSFRPFLLSDHLIHLGLELSTSTRTRQQLDAATNVVRKRSISRASLPGWMV